MDVEKVGNKDLCDPPKMAAGKDARPQEVVCYRAWDEIGELDLEERRKSEKSAVSLLASIAIVDSGFPGNACWSCGLM